MNARRMLAPAAALAISLATFFAAGEALAGPTFGGDLDLAFPIDSRGTTGGGFGLRLGYQAHMPVVAVTPEIAFTYHNLSGSDGPSIYRGVAGLRLGIGEVLRPGVSGHIGYAHFVPEFGPNKDAFTFDVGGFLDLTLIPLLDLGIHVVYNNVAADYVSGHYEFLTTGVHAALVF